MAIAAMTTSHPEARRTPPQSRPLLRVVENHQPLSDTGLRVVPRAPDPATAPPEQRLLATIASADRRADALAARIAAAQEELRILQDGLLEAEASLRARSLLLRGTLILLLPALATLAVASLPILPQLTGLASAPYPLIAAAVAAVVAAVHEQVAANRLLLTLFLPASSVLVVFGLALVLRLKWRPGLAVSER